MSITLHPAEGRPASVWKNGKGITREIAVFPAGADMANFDWRVSIADIIVDGPFSDFPGTDRILAALNGVILLGIGDNPAISLSRQSNPIAFPGDTPCKAQLVGRAARDLNVMTRRGRFSARMTRFDADIPISIAPLAHAILCVSLCEMTLEIDQSAIALKPLDAVSFDMPLQSIRQHLSRPLDDLGGPAGYIIQLFRPPGFGAPI